MTFASSSALSAPDEELSRLNLIAHETSHMWFGDLVTMRWFDDVWTKEVYANFMADKIAREQFPNINHDLAFIKSHYPLAFSTDRTQGTHPIQQPLDNMNKAGLLYGNIIYHKAPIMMSKLEKEKAPMPCVRDCVPICNVMPMAMPRGMTSSSNSTVSTPSTARNPSATCGSSRRECLSSNPTA